MNRLKWSSLMMVLAVFAAIPVLGQSANFGSLTLGSGKTSGVLTGSTGGSTSLPAIVSNSDRNNNACLGFGDPNPDHILILKKDFPRLKLQVNSGGETTLVVQSLDGEVRCSNNSSGDATLTDTAWKVGKYKIWIGSKTPGSRRDYTLTIKQ